MVPKLPVARRRFRFESLEGWQQARQPNLIVHRLTQAFPSTESFGLTSQTRRASYSIAANIAEGSGRNSGRDFARYLEIAYSSAIELASHVFLASDMGHVPGDAFETVMLEINLLAARIAALNRSLRTKISKVNLSESPEA